MQFAVYVDDYTIVQVYMDKHNMLTAQCVNTCADHVKTRHTHTYRDIHTCLNQMLKASAENTPLISVSVGLFEASAGAK